MNVTEEFLHKIRQLDGFNNAIITNIDVFTRKKVVCFYLVTDLAYSESVLPEAEEIAEAYMPAGLPRWCMRKNARRTKRCSGRKSCGL